jgi:hypothetical protein
VDNHQGSAQHNVLPLLVEKCLVLLQSLGGFQQGTVGTNDLVRGAAVTAACDQRILDHSIEVQESSLLLHTAFRECCRAHSEQWCVPVDWQQALCRSWSCGAAAPEIADRSTSRRLPW